MISAKNFWEWFEKNQAKYFFLNQIDEKEEKEKILDQFLEKLHQYSDKLFFEIGGHPDETQDLIITAEGDVDYFSKVEQLVNQAPKIKDWNIIAFKPPADSNFAIEYKGVKIDPKESWFLPLENDNHPNQLGLKIGIRDYSSSKKKDFLNAAYLALDSLLGEKSNALNIQHVEVDDIPDDPEEEGFISLLELPQYINWKESKQV